MIRSVLVANRGEIARRVFRTCRDLGLGTAAVFADPDAGAPHVREADTAVRLPGCTPADTYLRCDLLVRAAQDSGADAIHPGYGFLSESAEFARAVSEAGLTWIGPPPAAVAAMGEKPAAKRMMAKVGVPVLTAVDPERAALSDLPLLVKAAAGGGGRGMRAVWDLADLPNELAAARAEALSAFGNGEVFCEPYLERGRHIEVQLVADGHGTVWALGERDCSVQRRHQKVIEESPAPGVDDGLRAQLNRAAIAAARAIDYRGVGTVEFLVGEDGRFFFLEMNTRLQVEHPVTECVTGIDLVALQILVAEGGRLPERPPTPRGHAIEARLYAEDPARDWQPQAGKLHLLDVPGVSARFTVPGGAASGLRLDSGFDSEGAIGTSFDPLLAKVIAWAPSRAEAARRLADALARSRAHGLVTNRELLLRVLEHPRFSGGGVDTSFLTTHGPTLTAHRAVEKETEELLALAAALAQARADRAAAPVLAALPSGWRNVPSQPQTRTYLGMASGVEHQVVYRFVRGRLEAPDHPDAVLIEAAPDRVVLESAGVRRTFHVAVYGDMVHVDAPPARDGREGIVPRSAAFTELPRFPQAAGHTVPGSLLAPMPGTVIRVATAVGERVREGQPLLWLEAMKMEHQVTAPRGGTVTTLHAEPGCQIDVDTVLAVITPDPGTDERDPSGERAPERDDPHPRREGHPG